MLTVLVVEDERLFRDIRKIYLNSLLGMEMVDAVSDVGASIKTAGQPEPDVALMDI